MTEKVKRLTAFMLALMLCVSLAQAAFADDAEPMDYELLDVTLFCRTDFYQYVSGDDIFDLLSLAKDLGYTANPEEGAAEENFSFSDEKNTVMITLDERVTEDGYKVCKAIRYGKKDNDILCTFEREDRYDGSPLFSVNTADNYTVSMDQILLLTFIMENLDDKNPDPLADLYAEYYSSGIYAFPI